MWLEIVLWAIGIALSPTVTIAVILLLMSARPRANAGAMATGWILSLTAVAVLAFVLVFVFRVSGDGGTDPVVNVLRIVLGALLLGASGMLWWRTQRHGASTDFSRWTTALDSITPRHSFLLGIAVGDVKSFILTIAAATAVAAEPPDESSLLVLALLVFVLFASLGVLTPVVLFLMKGDRADDALRRWRDWLEANAGYVAGAVSLLFGLAVLGRGIAALAS